MAAPRPLKVAAPARGGGRGPEPPLRIFAAGRIAVQAGDVVVERHLGSRQARLAFAFLLAERNHPVSRDELAEVLWPRQLPRSWEAAIRVVVSKVRHFLEEAGLPGASTLVCAFGCYQLRLPPDAVVDLDLTASALVAAEGALGEDDPDLAGGQALVAHSLASQPFLPGEEGEWVDRRRAERHAQLLRSLEILAEVLARQGDVAQGVLVAEEAVALEPFRETAHRRLMQVHAAAGNRAEALRAYERCRRLLAEELGVSPSPETEAAYLELLGQERSPPAPIPSAPVVSARGADLPVGGLGLPIHERLGRAPGEIFVGREQELGLLRAVWEQCRAGHRQVVLLKGEAGSGKTRLVVRFVTTLPAGSTVLYGRCERGMDAAYQPFAQALSHYVAACPPDQLRHRMEGTAGVLARILPELPRYLPAPLLTALPEASGDQGLLFRAVTSFLVSLAAEGSVVLVVEDLQWAGHDDLLLLRHVARNLDVAPAMVMASYRREDAGPDLRDLLAELSREPAIHRLVLSGLDESAVAALLSEVTGTALDDAGLTLTRALHAETGGNAFLLTQLLGDLVASTSGHRPPTVEVLAGAPVPPGVEQVTAACRAGLSAYANRVLDLAAVAGEGFELAVLEEAAGLDEDALLDALDEAARAGVIFEVPGTVGRYRFVHALTRSAVLGALGGTRRGRLEERLRDRTRPGAGDPPGRTPPRGRDCGEVWEVLGALADAVQQARTRAED